MRLIDADALRENMKFVCMGVMAGTEPYAAPLTEIDNAPTIEPEQQWIPCNERLPEEKGEYLVTYHPCYWDNVHADIKVGIDSFRGKTTWAKNKYQRVIAWKPLDEPWRGEEP